MEGTRVGKMSCQFVAAVIAVLVALMMLSGPAAAGGKASANASHAAVTQAMKDTGKDGFNTWATQGCKRKSGRGLICRVNAEDDKGMRTKKCLLTYRLKKSGGAYKATLIKKSRCVRNPYPLLTRRKALDSVIAEGTLLSGQTVVVKKLERYGRSSFRGVVEWVRNGNPRNELCTLDVSVFVRKGISTSAGDPECFPTGEKRDGDNPLQYGPGSKYCPGDAGKTWNAKDDLIGMTLEEAAAFAKQKGCSVRPVIIDGVDQVITMDLRFNRVNVEIEGTEKRVVSIHGVY